MQAAMKTLLEQMRITEIDIDARKGLLEFDQQDVQVLLACKPLAEQRVDEIVETFYDIQTSNPDIAALIGDADTLDRLQSAQRRYILDLFGGIYGMEYINNRLRIGLVHKRIGVEPRFYLSAVHLLRRLLVTLIIDEIRPQESRGATLKALDKLIFFDVTLVFETYIQSMLSEIEAVKNRTEKYARALEETVAVRNGELRTDALTGLTTRRYLHEALHCTLQAAQRRGEPVSLIFVDVDNFKALNDRKGHAYGDKVLAELGRILLETARGEDTCVRYGGDEFCIVLANSTEEQACATYCQRINRLLEDRLPGVSISMGIMQTGPDHYDGAEAMLKSADRRMYLHKLDKRCAGKGQSEDEPQVDIAPEHPVRPDHTDGKARRPSTHRGRP
ncbi:MAG: GGDEF domain-containing protein [Alcanivorax sp.]|nr:GGDEF domain-containing protein [Alcanivorax sp.]